MFNPFQPEQSIRQQLENLTGDSYQYITGGVTVPNHFMSIGNNGKRAVVGYNDIHLMIWAEDSNGSKIKSITFPLSDEEMIFNHFEGCVTEAVAATI